MTVLDIILTVVTVLALAFAGLCYRELWRWSRQYQRTRIAIAYNRRVKFNATLAEWLNWSKSLEENERGRVVYQANKMSVSVLKPTLDAKTTVKHTPPEKEKVAA